MIYNYSMIKIQLGPVNHNARIALVNILIICLSIHGSTVSSKTLNQLSSSYPGIASFKITSMLTNLYPALLLQVLAMYFVMRWIQCHRLMLCSYNIQRHAIIFFVRAYCGIIHTQLCFMIKYCDILKNHINFSCKLAEAYSQIVYQ